MKIESMTISTPVPAFVKPEDRATNYKDLQEKWKEQRVKDWEWSSVSDDMAFEAVVALTKDLQANEGAGAVTTLMRVLTALTMDLPVDKQSFGWEIPLVCRMDQAQPETVTLNMSTRPSVEKDPEDDAALGLTLVAENDEDRARLQDLGVLNETKTISSADAIGFLEESVSDTSKEKSEVPSLDRWDRTAIRKALVEAQQRWPEESSPMQAMAVVAGAVIWLRGQSINASNCEMTLSGVTDGDTPERAPIDATLAIVSRPAVPVDAPVFRSRSPR
jgi:hypothetical protein